MRKIAGLVLCFSTLVVHAQTADVVRSVQGPALLRPDSLVSAGQWLYFLAWDGVRTESGSPVKSLWRTDGTPEGTVELMPTPGGLRAAGNWLFFGNSEKPGELWITDGTPSGTRRATELLSRFPENATIRFALGDTLFVAVGLASELWTTKITPGSPAVRLGVEGSAGDPLLEANGRVLFLAGKTRAELVASDGTPEGTYTLGTLPDGGLESLAVMAGHFYIFREGGDGISLWRTDGTPEDTVRIASVPGIPSNLVVAGRNLFFVVSGKLWVSDGTAAGTRELPAQPLETIAAAGDRVVFRGMPTPQALTGAELWVSDGTPEGTFLLRDIHRGVVESYLSDLTSVGPLVYFAATSQEDGRELWVTDGTAEGTRIAADLSTHQTGSNPDQITRAGERVFFTAIRLGSPVVELWALPLPGPPRLAIEAALVSEGAAARFRVTLSRAASEPVTAGYETADGTASAGADYDPRSGTLSFAPGETSRTIEIPGRDDSAVEPHETFSVTLRDAAGAALPGRPAFAFIEDDDRTADVALTLDLSRETQMPVVVQTANHGPYAAHGVRYSKTVTPVQSFAAPCATRCIGLAGSLATGQTTRENGFGETDARQHYFTWTVAAHERDPNPGNNTIGWTTARNMAMNALYLTPDQEATVWFYPGQPGTGMKMESSDPRVVAVPATLDTVPGKLATTFVVRALAAGRTTLRVAPDTWMEGTMDIVVVAPGAKRRWPSQVFADRVGGMLRLDEQTAIRIKSFGTAPIDGRMATGLVTIRANGREAAQVRLTEEVHERLVPLHLAEVGLNVVTVEYEGDETFLPSTSSIEVPAARGRASIAGSASRSGASVTVTIAVTGSPLTPPTGTVTVSETGAFAPIEATLVTTASGRAEARVTLPGVAAGLHTFLLTYSGDARYDGATQELRFQPKSRAARH